MWMLPCNEKLSKILKENLVSTQKCFFSSRFKIIQMQIQIPITAELRHLN